MEKQQQKIFDCLNEPEAFAKIRAIYYNDMKNLLILAVITIFTLSSFATNTTEDVKLISKTGSKINNQTFTTWYYLCRSGRRGSFICNGCDRSEATIIANSNCQ